MNFLLQAAYKVIEIPVHSCYDISKDFIAPIFGSALGVVGAYVIMRKQIKKTKNLNDAEEIKSKSEMISFTRLYLEEVLNENNENIQNLTVFRENNSFEKTSYVKMIILQNGYLKTLLEIDSSKLFWAFQGNLSSIESKKKYTKFTGSLKLMDSYIDYVSNNLNEFINNVQVLVQKIDDLFKDAISFIQNEVNQNVFSANNELVKTSGFFWNKLISINRSTIDENESKSILLLNLVKDVITHVEDVEISLILTDTDKKFLMKYVIELLFLLDKLKELYSFLKDNCSVYIKQLEIFNTNLDSFRSSITAER